VNRFALGGLEVGGGELSISSTKVLTGKRLTKHFHRKLDNIE
jgi:hypothetical protein